MMCDVRTAHHPYLSVSELKADQNPRKNPLPSPLFTLLPPPCDNFKKPSPTRLKPGVSRRNNGAASESTDEATDFIGGGTFSAKADVDREPGSSREQARKTRSRQSSCHTRVPLGTSSVEAGEEKKAPRVEFWTSLWFVQGHQEGGRGGRAGQEGGGDNPALDLSFPTEVFGLPARAEEGTPTALAGKGRRDASIVSVWCRSCLGYP